jgi:two-component system response regulator DesR
VIRTLIAESVALVRAGLLALLAKEPDINVVAELDRRELVVPAACRLQPDVALVDGDMAAYDGFAAVRELHAHVPACGLVIMASSPSPCELREAVAASADGFVVKDSAPDKITEAIRRVAAGKKALDPDLAFSTLNSAASPLTAREIDVLRLAAQGEPAMEIAGKLYLSVGTVRNYMSRVIGKTGARNRMDAIRIAEGAGWL